MIRGVVALALVGGGGCFIAPSAPSAPFCAGPSGWQLCFPAEPSGHITLAETVGTTDAVCLDPTPTSWTDQGQPDACIVAAGTISIESTTVHGRRPLVLVAGTISVVTLLDVSSQRSSGQIGPGAPYVGCGAFAMMPLGNQNGGDGGAGGSFMFKGGDGKPGDNQPRTFSIAPPAETNEPATLRGGCSGQPGYAEIVTSLEGVGGGAVYLAASQAIAISGVINASGAGASTDPTCVSGNFGTNHQCGGSGGGTGGSIVLDSPVINATGATLIANGGGGASGQLINGSGNIGFDPSPATPTLPAAGGAPSSLGGAGGAGYSSTSVAQTGKTGFSNSGGGGGGGGGGYIRSNVDLLGAVAVTPPASVHQ